jgi:putative nucleotidyltransferase with HDIG domain
MATTAITLVKKVKNLPPVSEAALKLLSLLEQFSVDNNDVVQVLKYDNVLTAKLLKACNSASLGLGDSVSSVDEAVFILGHEQILHIVMTLAFGGAMTASSLGNAMEVSVLWQHSLVSAMASEILLEKVPELDAKANVAFTASLLHDIGKLVLGQTLSAEELSEIRDRIERKQIPVTEAEKEVVGVDHGEVGAALLDNWRLPENIVEAVANHHRPVLKPNPRLSTLVHICNSLAHHSNPTPGQTIHDLRIAEEVVGQFDITGEKMDSMTAAVRESFERVDSFMALV